jgi:hypothetical protein
MIRDSRNLEAYRQRRLEDLLLHHKLALIRLNPKIGNEELQTHLDALTRKLQEGNERGNESEAKVLGILWKQSRSLIVGANYCDTNQDIAGLDLWVDVHPGRLKDDQNKFYVQVKSSDKGLRSYNARYTEAERFERHIILIDARKTDEEILQDFWSQVDTIDAYSVAERRKFRPRFSRE